MCSTYINPGKRPIHIYENTYIHTYMYACVCLCVCTQILNVVHIQTFRENSHTALTNNIHTCIYAYTYIHIYMSVYTYMCLCVRVWVCDIIAFSFYSSTVFVSFKCDNQYLLKISNHILMHQNKYAMPLFYFTLNSGINNA